MSPESSGSPWDRVVVDTNVMISAALSPDGAPALLLDQLLQVSRLVFSRQTFAELESRLWKPKFDRYLSIETRQGLLHDFDAAALWVEIPEVLEASTWCSDPDDDHFIRAALQAQARYLITGDRDLLTVEDIKQLTICTPRKALVELVSLLDDG